MSKCIILVKEYKLMLNLFHPLALLAKLLIRNSINILPLMNSLVFPFKIECVQTDNGQEFTKNPSLTQFQRTLNEHGIIHKMIKPYTPRHNGKVERSHRKDNEYFYAIAKFYSLMILNYN